MAERLSEGYQVCAWRAGVTDVQRAGGRSNAKYSQIVTVKREAIRECRRATLKLGIGARGEVYGGKKYEALVYQVRVTANDTGTPVLKVEEL